MYSLAHTFLDYDLSLLRAIAEAAGIELQSGKPRKAAAELAESYKQVEFVALLLAGLSSEASAALQKLQAAGGHIPVARFEREYGAIRPFGSGAREREQPHLQAANVSEVLWYRGLIGRAFSTVAGESEEHIYIPLDLDPLLPDVIKSNLPAPQIGLLSAITDFVAARSTAVDDMCTLLAYLQPNSTILDEAGQLSTETGDQLRSYLRKPAALGLTVQLARELGWISGHPLALDSAWVRAFLDGPRVEQLHQLVEAWRDSPGWHDFLNVPGLLFEKSADKHGDALRARAAVLETLQTVPVGEWCSLDGLVAYLYKHKPDFQRVAGDYDSPFVRDAGSDEILRGFGNWGRVDGALIRFIVVGPMHWLGLTDISRQPLPTLAESNAGAIRETAFRLTSLFAALTGQACWKINETPATIQVYGNGSLRLSRAVSRYDRFQAARIAAWRPLRDAEHYDYEITANSLLRAAEDGVALRHVMTFLQRASGGQLPPRLQAALARYGDKGVEAQLRWTHVLQVRSEEVMEQLRDNPRTRRFLGPTLGPLAVEVRARDWQNLQQAMLELGLLLERNE